MTLTASDCTKTFDYIEELEFHKQDRVYIKFIVFLFFVVEYVQRI